MFLNISAKPPKILLMQGYRSKVKLDINPSFYFKFNSFFSRAYGI